MDNPAYKVWSNLPFIIKTWFLHTLGLSATAKKWDLKTELTIKIIRKKINGPRRSVTESQAASLKDQGVYGKKWISKYTIPQPSDDDVRTILFQVIDDLKTGGETYTQPALLPVEVEWTGYRDAAGENEPEPTPMAMNEADKYKRLMTEAKTPVTILYFHGGAYYMLDPASHRTTVARLCKLTSGRAMSVRYRLAPQNPFPAALLDAFVAYLSLLHPPKGAMHEPVSADTIVFAGDSAGANLCLALMQLLLRLHRRNVKQLFFNGSLVNVPLPAGITLNSPWCDMTASFESITKNAQFDYLRSSWDRDAVPACSIWPADPPRLDYFADGSMLTHPLVSQVLAPDWSSCPPMYICVGEELLADEGKALASRVANEGVKIAFEQYEAMPHCFALVLANNKASDKCFENWGKFIKDCVCAASVPGNGVFYKAKTLEEQRVSPSQLLESIGLDWGQVERRMKNKQLKAIHDFEQKQAATVKTG